ncbi:MAG: beta-ketoacyl-[acyl-carrier-protein] synthase family protein [Deltaproteobacteria bacterium]|nr:beta-ketoacyl-[acyl-carrier-protein] synthase family protein [Deltaproteobacteria bacterium]MBW2660720.1 beta-ketoacyl-[acyl-carrier-protein] synthase family protein [Deltaproteobacteria bacterium]
MNKDTDRRVAVTGLGIITSIGDSLPAFREGLFSGKCGIEPISLFDTTGFSCHFAGQIKNIDMEGFFNLRKIRRNSRCDLLGLIAANEAMLDSGLNIAKYTKERIGVVLGGGAGGMLSWEKYRRALWLKTRPKPSLLLPTTPCTLTDLVASRYKLTGLRATICTACSSSTTSIGYGFDLIRSGDQDIVVTGGSESLSELTFSGFHSLRLMDPEYCRPFDRYRRGLSLGEGAAILILEDYERAEDRNATIYAEVLGYATNSDAVHITSPDAGGMSRAMVQALRNANIDVDQVGYINAHGTATRINDQMETRAIKNVFEGHAGDLAISSTKSMVGHCLGASGAIEGIATVLALHEQVVPPTIHLELPDPDCDLDYVPNYSRKQEINIAMSNSFAFGGNNTSVVFGRSKA